jgi:uncharacterized protein with FMN-binding domain
MNRAFTAVASAAFGLGVVLALHNPRPSIAAPPGNPSSRARAGGGGTGKGGTPPSTTPASSGAKTEASGKAVQYGYGVLSVRVTVRGSRIVSVTLSSLQTADSYSQSIADQVIPMLRQEVLQAQSAHVNVVSGATYTSEAYLSSLQSALDSISL